MNNYKFKNASRQTITWFQTAVSSIVTSTDSPSHFKRALRPTSSDLFQRRKELWDQKTPRGRHTRASRSEEEEPLGRRWSLLTTNQPFYTGARADDGIFWNIHD